MLRGFLKSSRSNEVDEPSRTLLWLYIPDYSKKGRMGDIEYIPKSGMSNRTNAIW